MAIRTDALVNALFNHGEVSFEVDGQPVDFKDVTVDHDTGDAQIVVALVSRTADPAEAQ